MLLPGPHTVVSTQPDPLSLGFTALEPRNFLAAMAGESLRGFGVYWVVGFTQRLKVHRLFFSLTSIGLGFTLFLFFLDRGS